MTAKEYLEEVFTIRQKIIELMMQEEELRTIAEGLKTIVYDKEKVQVSVKGKLEDTVAEMVELGDNYGREIIRLHKAIQEREAKISQMKPEQEKILRWRYLKHDGKGRQMTLRQIAKKISYSYDRVKHIHTEALQIFEKRFMKDSTA